MCFSTCPQEYHLPPQAPNGSKPEGAKISIAVLDRQSSQVLCASTRYMMISCRRWGYAVAAQLVLTFSCQGNFQLGRVGYRNRQPRTNEMDCSNDQETIALVKKAYTPLTTDSCSYDWIPPPPASRSTQATISQRSMTRLDEVITARAATTSITQAFPLAYSYSRLGTALCSDSMFIEPGVFEEQISNSIQIHYNVNIYGKNDDKSSSTSFPRPI